MTNTALKKTKQKNLHNRKTKKTKKQNPHNLNLHEVISKHVVRYAWSW